MRGVHTGGAVEESWLGVMTQGTQTGPGDPTAINSSPIASYRSEDLGLGKINSRGKEENKTKALTHIKATYIVSFSITWSCRQ